MPFRAVLFDLDGTLLNTLDDLADAMNSVLAAQGLPVHPTDAYRYFVGDGARALAERVLPPDHDDPELVDVCLSKFRAAYAQNWDAKTRPYPGIPGLLDALTTAGIPMAVFSNKPHDDTVRCVVNLLPTWTFMAVFGLREGVPRKPDPAGALEIAAAAGMLPAEFAYLGDTATDMQTAVAAGMFPVGALWGFRTEQELLDNGAQMVIREPRQLLPIVATI